ncbi:unnamed protein product [Linum trigynum]|uniref:Uncharacterized protein n=1 Tax=Linum trigynum TaxID=586398 RepID=A0AAV2GPN7_9ROSI
MVSGPSYFSAMEVELCEGTKELMGNLHSRPSLAAEPAQGRIDYGGFVPRVFAEGEPHDGEKRSKRGP